MFNDLMESFDEMMKEFDDKMNSMGQTMPRFKYTIEKPEPTPHVDLFITKDTVYLDIALPGFEKYEIVVVVNDNRLIITAKKEYGVSGIDQRFPKKSQIVKNNVLLEWTVDQNVHDLENISPSLNLGILYIKIPFKKVEKPTPINRAFVVQ